MTTPKSDRQWLTGHYHDDHGAMDTFTVRWPRCRFVRLFGRNPLVRISDRVEALVLVFAVVVSLLAVPIAAAVGTAVYDSRKPFYAEQARKLHLVTATVTDPGKKPSMKLDNPNTLNARWFAAGAEHAGVIKTREELKPGDSVNIWVRQDGTQVRPPAPTKTAAEEAALAAMGTWSAVAVAAAALVVGTRAVLDRIRNKGWQQAIKNLIGDSDGHTALP